jgi:hypothetical protein
VNPQPFDYKSEGLLVFVAPGSTAGSGGAFGKLEHVRLPGVCGHGPADVVRQGAKRIDLILEAR